jgi:hypothetical protein
VGISVTHRDGRIETVAATDQFVIALDELQYEVREGPCLEAIRSCPVVRIDDAKTESRWPAFIPRAVDLGLRSQLGLRLYVEDETLGGINIYATEDEVFDDETQDMAELFAAQCAVVLGRAQSTENLYTALGTRKMIGQAIGLVMERHQMDEDAAFLYLTKVSQASNVKLRDVAAELVREANGCFNSHTGSTPVRSAHVSVPLTPRAAEAAARPRAGSAGGSRGQPADGAAPR